MLLISSEPRFKVTIDKYLLISDLSSTWEREVKNENDEEEYFPIFKKANVVGSSIWILEKVSCQNFFVRLFSTDWLIKDQHLKPMKQDQRSIDGIKDIRFDNHLNI